MSIETGVIHAMEWVALGVELTAALVLVIGAIEALTRVFAILPRLNASLGEKRMIWLHFARWLVLALEFELAADIVRTGISPSWEDIGQLAAIAAIRTMLSYFLGRDMTEAATPSRDAGAAMKAVA